MKKKISALILVFFIGIMSILYNFDNVYATGGGIVEAEIIWQGFETLALMLGTTVDFDNNLSISKNNQNRIDMYKGFILDDYNAGRITDVEYQQRLADLDSMVENMGSTKLLKITQGLWSSFVQWTYRNDIFTQPNLSAGLSPDSKAVFDAYEGRCAIYGILDNDLWNNFGASYIVIFSDALTGTAVKKYNYNESANAQYWLLADGQNTWTYIYNNDAGIRNAAGELGYFFEGQTIQIQFFDYKTSNQEITDEDNDALVTVPSLNDYTDKLNALYSFENGDLVIDKTGDLPAILDGETVGGIISDIQDGTTTWEDAVPQVFEADDSGAIEGENPVIGKKALDEMVTGLRLNRLKTKFPFCIPSDIYHMVVGAGYIDDEAPVIKIPIHIEFRGYVYYDNDEAVIIDFNQYQSVINVFRAGFFLLFLIGMIYLTIEVLHSFFVVTE